MDASRSRAPQGIERLQDALEAGPNLCALALQRLDTMAERRDLVSSALELSMEHGNLVLGSEGR
jgi:hypothetical protein